MIAIELLFRLLAGHAIADYGLQGDTMAKYKRRASRSDVVFGFGWYYWLGAHALIHGGMTYVATGNVWVGGCETLAHACIDAAKCEGKLGRHAMLVDQGLHVACKILYVIALSC